jgi:hypothetical protein
MDRHAPHCVHVLRRPAHSPGPARRLPHRPLRADGQRRHQPPARLLDGPTPTEFSVALDVAGDALTTVGASDISPKTPFYRLFYTFLAVVGLSVLTLTVTYFLEVYNALQARNTYVVKVHPSPRT